MCNEDGIYISDYCKNNGFDECALMITDFPGKLLFLKSLNIYEEFYFNEVG